MPPVGGDAAASWSLPRGVLVLLGLAAALALSIARLATLVPTYQDTFGQPERPAEAIPPATPELS